MSFRQSPRFISADTVECKLQDCFIQSHGFRQSPEFIVVGTVEYKSQAFFTRSLGYIQLFTCEPTLLNEGTLGLAVSSLLDGCYYVPRDRVRMNRVWQINHFPDDWSRAVALRQPTPTPSLPDKTKSQHSPIYAVKLYSPVIHFSIQCNQNYVTVIKTVYNLSL